MNERLKQTKLAGESVLIVIVIAFSETQPLRVG